MKKILAMLLSVVMVITAAPITAVALDYSAYPADISDIVVCCDCDGFPDLAINTVTGETESCRYKAYPGGDILLPAGMSCIYDETFEMAYVGWIYYYDPWDDCLRDYLGYNTGSDTDIDIRKEMYETILREGKYKRTRTYSLPSSIEVIGEFAFKSAYLSISQYGDFLPSSLKTIGNYAFSDADYLYVSKLPSGLESIGEGAFSDMSNGLLGDRGYGFQADAVLTIPDSVTYLGQYAFSDCDGLYGLVLGSGLSQFYMNSIAGTNVSELTIPETVTTLSFYGYSETYESREPLILIQNRTVKIEGANCSIESIDEDGYDGYVNIDVPHIIYYHKNTQTETNLKQFKEEHSDLDITLIPFEGEEPEHEHTWGQWVYNEDAVEEKNGTQTRTCTECGESETEEAPNTAKLKRSGNALALEDSVALKTYVDKATVDYYDEVYAEFERNGKVTKAALSKDTLTFNDTEYAVFDFNGIAPQAMDDEITITIYGVKDGITYNGESYKYSVTEYIDRTLENTEDEKLKTMLVDLLYYGAECQIYSGYKTDSLMTDILTEEEKAYKSEDALNLTNIKDASYATCENRFVRFGTALRLNNSVEIATALNISGITVDDLTFKVKAGDREEQTFTKAENPNNFEFANGYWYFYYDELFADQFSDEVYITAYYNGEPVSYTLKYSVESYAATVKDTALKKVTDAMMHYGNSAKAYANKEA